MKQIVIIKDSKSKIKIDTKYIEVSSIYENRVIAKHLIKELYINAQISVIPAKLLKLTESFDIYFINFHGRVLGQLKHEEV